MNLMTTKLNALALLFGATFAFSQTDSFHLPLPSVTAMNRITPVLVNYADAVYLCKQQNYTEALRALGSDEMPFMTNEMNVSSQYFIVKVLNSAGVQHFSVFSMEYPASTFKEPRHRLTVRARIIKPDSTIWILPDSEITVTTSHQATSGRPLTERKEFRLHNLNPGDLLQLEYEHYVPYSFMGRAIMPYHDAYPVLESDVGFTLPKEEKVDDLSFPSDQVGQPKVTESGQTVTTLWSVKNLTAIPVEPCSPPFGDVSYLTAVVNRTVEKDSNGWRPLAKAYVKSFLGGSTIPKSFFKQLGLDPNPDSAGWGDIQHLYSALRKYFTLPPSNSVFPATANVRNLIDEREADASDQAFIMMRMLDRWNVRTTPILIRDKREGVYEPKVPLMSWFDRLAVMVTVDSVRQVFDFDQCIPSTYEMPWFLNGIGVVGLSDTGATHFSVSGISRLRDHISRERHTITLQDGRHATDSVMFTLKSAAAQRMRGAMYALKGQDILEHARGFVNSCALKDADSAEVNDFLNEREIRVTAHGKSQGITAEIDTFLTFKPHNQLLRAFSDNFTATRRYNRIVLDEPFADIMEWTINAPAGYKLSVVPQEQHVEGPQGTSANVSYLQADSGTCVISADVTFNLAGLKQEEYAAWRSFLENATSIIEREVAFVRCKPE